MTNYWVDRAARIVRRRTFLKALGLGLAAPAALRIANAALAAPSARPRRFMLFYIPHGVPPEHFNPVRDPAGGFALEGVGESVLGPLEPRFKPWVNVVQGVSYPMANTHEAILSFLTELESSTDSVTPRTSLEHVIAQGMGVRPLVLGACAYSQYGLSDNSKLMWDGQPVVPEKSPVKAYDTTFANVVDPNAGEAERQAELRSALLSLTATELRELERDLTGLTSEQTKLKNHLAAVEALRERGGAGPSACTGAPRSDAVDMLRAASSAQPDEFWLTEQNFPAILAAQLEVAAHALVCGVSPLVAVQALYTTCQFDFGFMGVPGAHHDPISHSQPQMSGATVNMEARAPFARAQRWFVEQLVEHCLTILDQDDPSDPGRSVLDNTLIYLCSEIGDGAWHTTETRVIQVGPEPGPTAYIPVVTIGGGSGAIRTGQLLTVETNRPARDLYLTFCRAMGLDRTSYGSSTAVIEELLV